MHHLRLIRAFAKASAQQEMAHRANFFISVLHALLSLGVGITGLLVLFNQVESVQGWDFAAMLALLGVYLTLNALRSLCFGPSMEALAGLGGAIWQGTFDFTLLRPVHPQFMVTFQQWQPLALFDLCLGLGVLGSAIYQMNQALTLAQIALFLAALTGAVAILYSLLLALTSLVFWGGGFFYTWIFNGIMQMARYPVQLYPGWLRFVLTWVLPVGVMTTVPAEALSGALSVSTLVASAAISLVLFAAASLLFRAGLRRYASASS